jgi:steroid 5-alpha reductase family enzyme
MFSLTVYLRGLGVLIAAAVPVWALSLGKRNVAIVDSLWSLMFVLAASVYALSDASHIGPRGVLLLSLLTLWALRLSIYITWRNWGLGEDRRYQAIRARNAPHFACKSFYLVFALQAVLAWLISLPLLGSLLSAAPLGIGDFAGAALWLMGMIFEAGGDWQLARFKAHPLNQGRIMDQGLWRFTRHPNYFGDFCVWWGFYLMAVSAGAWWSVTGPVLMSALLLRVSGVPILEKDMAARRPQYVDYIRRTNAFFPGMPKT